VSSLANQAPPAVPRVVADGRGAGVRLYAGERCPPEPAAFERLMMVSRLPWVAAPVVALPDLHWKERLETPSSTAVATRDDIVMAFSSPSQNCGMNLLATPLTQRDLSDDFLDRLMDALRETIPRRRRSPELSRDEVIRFCAGGAPAAAQRYGLDPALCATIEASGNTLAGEEPTRDELEAVADNESLEMGRWSFAYIGGGNHFLELQVVEEVLDPPAARALGLAPGGLVMMFHTGSERLGHDLGRLYAWRRKTEPKRRIHLMARKLKLHFMRDVRSLGDLRRRWAMHFSKQDYIAVPAASREGQKLALTLKLAANFGYANRVAVTGLIQQALRHATGSEDLALRIVADLSHNTIMRERIGGRQLWVHRHNAARTVGPAGMPEGHPYRQLGQPVMVPGTARTSSYVVVGCDGASESLYSVDHGAGRTVDRFQASGYLSARPGRTTRRYSYAQRAPEILEHLSDEGIDEVMSVAASGGIARPAVRMRPVAVLKA